MSSVRRYGADAADSGSAEIDGAVALSTQVGVVAAVPCGAVPGYDEYDEVAALRRQVAQLQQALQSRGVIEQAKGMLMLCYDVDSDHAFAILRRFSQHRNVKLHTIAHTLVHAIYRHDVTTSWDTTLVRWLHEQLNMDESSGTTGRDREHAGVTLDGIGVPTTF